MKKLIILLFASAQLFAATTIELEQGTALTWTSSGGDFLLTVTGLVDDAAQQGAKGDLGSTFANRYHMMVQIDTGAVLPVAGEVVNIYLAWSTITAPGTDNPAGLSGTDIAYTGYNTDLDDSLKNLVEVYPVPMTGTANTVHTMMFIVYAKSQYVIPVVVNRSGETLGGTGTDHKIVLTPIRDVIP